MTEEARKTVEEINKKRIMDELNKKVDNSTLDSATDEAMYAISVLSDVIRKKVESTEDKVVMIGGAALLDQFLPFAKSIVTYRDLCEASDLIAEMEKNK